MPRTVEYEDLKRHTLWLYAGDFDKLSAIYPDVGASVIIRKIVRKHLERIESGVSPISHMKVEKDV